MHYLALHERISRHGFNPHQPKIVITSSFGFESSDATKTLPKLQETQASVMSCLGIGKVPTI
jgi:hypothetical protein